MLSREVCMVLLNTIHNNTLLKECAIPLTIKDIMYPASFMLIASVIRQVTNGRWALQQRLKTREKGDIGEYVPWLSI
jgi:hypothetical protein